MRKLEGGRGGGVGGGLGLEVGMQGAEPVFTQTPAPSTLCFCSCHGLTTVSQGLRLKYPATLCVLTFIYTMGVKAKGSKLSADP